MQESFRLGCMWVKQSIGWTWMHAVFSIRLPPLPFVISFSVDLPCTSLCSAKKLLFVFYNFYRSISCSPFTHLLHLRALACMEQTREGSPYNACSTLLSMDCQIMDQQSASKPSLQQASVHKISTSCNLSSNINYDDQYAEREEEMEENTDHNGMLQGSMIFDMLSAMQFNSHSTAINTIQEQANNNNFLNITTPSSQKAIDLSSTMSPDANISSPWHLNLYNNNSRAIDTPYQGHTIMDTSSFLSSKDNHILQSAPPSGFDPIASFLKLPVLADQTKNIGLINSYSSYLSNNKEDPCGAAQGYSTSNNNWITSLQLESITDCSNVNNDNMEDEVHVVQYLDHNNIEGAEEAKLLMKLNVDHSSLSSHDNIGSHHEERVLNESYNSSSLHMLSNYHNEEQLLYTLNEGGDIEGGHGSGMLDNMHMMMGYNNDPRANVQFGVLKGGASSSVMGGNVKTTRKRGVRGSGKNSEERENQRMTHIAVERNRRRQMNEHLRVLRALMPPSYIQRGDQASIIGGAIEFVRELEQLLQCLESQKRRRIMVNPVNVMPQPTIQQPGLLNTQAAPFIAAPDHHLQLQAPPICMLDDGGLQNIQEEVAQAKSAVADIEVKVVEKREALIKILSQRRPRQLLHTIQALQDQLHLSILHTNVTTIDNTVLYSFTVKIHNDRDCSANHIATLVHGIFIDIINQNPIKEF